MRAKLEKILYDDNLPVEVKVYRIANTLRKENAINHQLWYAILDMKNKHAYEYEWNTDTKEQTKEIITELRCAENDND